MNSPAKRCIALVLPIALLLLAACSGTQGNAAPAQTDAAEAPAVSETPAPAETPAPPEREPDFAGACWGDSFETVSGELPGGIDAYRSSGEFCGLTVEDDYYIDESGLYMASRLVTGAYDPAGACEALIAALTETYGEPVMQQWLSADQTAELSSLDEAAEARGLGYVMWSVRDASGARRSAVQLELRGTRVQLSYNGMGANADTQPETPDFGAAVWGESAESVLEGLGPDACRVYFADGSLAGMDTTDAYIFAPDGGLHAGKHTFCGMASAEDYVRLREYLTDLYGEPQGESPADAAQWVLETSTVVLELDGTQLNLSITNNNGAA